jgi:hypothetical protein
MRSESEKPWIASTASSIAPAVIVAVRSNISGSLNSPGWTRKMRPSHGQPTTNRGSAGQQSSTRRRTGTARLAPARSDRSPRPSIVPDPEATRIPVAHSTTSEGKRCPPPGESAAAARSAHNPWRSSGRTKRLTPVQSFKPMAFAATTRGGRGDFCVRPRLRRPDLRGLPIGYQPLLDRIPVMACRGDPVTPSRAQAETHLPPRAHQQPVAI